MTAPDPDSPAHAGRPALVDELERMGFSPADLTRARPVQQPASGDAAPQAPAVPEADAAPEPAQLVQPAEADLSVDADVPPAVVLRPRRHQRPSGAHADRSDTHLYAPPEPGGHARTVHSSPVPGPAHAGSTSTQGELTAESVLRPRQASPSGGWRRAVFAATFGTVDPGPSTTELRDRDLIARATRPVPGCWRIAVLSLKGGVGKTTTTAALGVQLATLRGDRALAVDANPDRGTLAEKVPDPNPATVRDLLRDRDALLRASDVRAYTSLSPSRLEVLASDSDPAVSQAFGEAEYRSAMGVLQQYYSVLLTDCGTGLLHSAMTGVLGLADALVVVTSPALDSARSASATLDWLRAHGHAALAEHSVVVVNAVRPGGGQVDVPAVREHFAGRCRAVVDVPFDPHLEAGAVVGLEQLRPRTRQAYLQLAAHVGDGITG